MGEGLSPGKQIDRYTVVRHVAAGGMGSIWEGRLTGKHGFAKRVAIKTIRPELAGEPQFLPMFLEEARLASRLSHANVAQVLDVGEHEGTTYIVFEWVDGRSLEALCLEAAARGQTVATDLAVRVLADVCAGLHAVHELRDDAGQPLHVVHRDVTPHNVLVSPEGFAKVIDLGLAKARDRAGAATRSGLVKGTPEFMAPEQAMGRPLDRRADVFAAGAVLFRVLAGSAPFPDREALAGFIEGERAPELPAHVPQAVREVVATAMRRDPHERFATAAEMRVALERAVVGQQDDGRQATGEATPAPALAPTPVEGARLALARTELATGTYVSTGAPTGRWLVVGLALAAVFVGLAVALALRP